MLWAAPASFAAACSQLRQAFRMRGKMQSTKVSYWRFDFPITGGTLIMQLNKLRAIAQ